MMIAVLMSTLIAAGTVGGDTLSTRGLAKDFSKFFHPPAVFLNQNQGATWQGSFAPLILITPFGVRRLLTGYRTMNRRQGHERDLESVKRNDKNPRRKK